MYSSIMTQVEFVVNAPRRVESGFRAGFEAFCRGRRLDELHDPAARRGWWAALDAAADCETDGYLAGQGGA